MAAQGEKMFEASVCVSKETRQYSEIWKLKVKALVKYLLTYAP